MKEFVKNIINFIPFAVGLIPTTLVCIFQPTTPVPYGILLVILFLLICFIWLFLMYYFKYKEEILLKESSSELAAYKCFVNENIIICRSNSNIGLNCVVTVCILQDEYEKPLGYGYVRNIQENKIVQIELLKNFQNDFSIKDTMNLIKINLGNIVIKTYATINSLNIKVDDAEAKNEHKN